MIRRILVATAFAALTAPAYAADVYSCDSSTSTATGEVTVQPRTGNFAVTMDPSPKLGVAKYSGPYYITQYVSTGPVIKVYTMPHPDLTFRLSFHRDGRIFLGATGVASLDCELVP